MILFETGILTDIFGSKNEAYVLIPLHILYFSGGIVFLFRWLFYTKVSEATIKEDSGITISFVPQYSTGEPKV